LYPAYVATGYLSGRWLSRNKLFCGIDYSYHESIYAYLLNNRLATGREQANAWKSALIGGNEFLFGRVGIVFQGGIYIKQAYLRSDAIYEKIGACYYLVQREKGPVKELYLGAFVKAHFTVAELGEVGLGVGF